MSSACAENCGAAAKAAAGRTLTLAQHLMADFDHFNLHIDPEVCIRGRFAGNGPPVSGSAR